MKTLILKLLNIERMQIKKQNFEICFYKIQSSEFFFGTQKDKKLFQKYFLWFVLFAFNRKPIASSELAGVTK